MASLSFNLESSVDSRRSLVPRNRVRVRARVDGDAVFDLDGGMALKLSTLQARFPNACGLKYYRVERGEEVLQNLDLSNGMIYPPAQGWEEYCIYHCVFRESGEPQRLPTDEHVTPVGSKVRSLVVLGIDLAITLGELREYFQKFGELFEATICHRPGAPSNFGFIKFVDGQSELIVLRKRRHEINRIYRSCDVKVYRNRITYIETRSNPCKVSVSSIPGSTTKQRLFEYFSRYGDVIDILFINPTWAFVTFMHITVGRYVCGQRHVLDGVQMRVVLAMRAFATVPNKTEGKKLKIHDTWTHLPALPTLVRNDREHSVEQNIVYKPQYIPRDVSHHTPCYSHIMPQGPSGDPSGTPQSRNYETRYELFRAHNIKFDGPGHEDTLMKKFLESDPRDRSYAKIGKNLDYLRKRYLGTAVPQ